MMTKTFEIKKIDQGDRYFSLILYTAEGFEKFIREFREGTLNPMPAMYGVQFAAGFKPTWIAYLNTKIVSDYGLRMCRLMWEIESGSAYRLSSRAVWSNIILYTEKDDQYGNPAWNYREKNRIYNRIYKEVSNDIPRDVRIAINSDVGHMSVKDDGMFAYTPDNDHGNADRQISTRIGRYLNRLVKDGRIEYDANGLRDIGTLISAGAAPVVALFAHTRDEIDEVYQNGPGSCMVVGHSEASGLTPDVTPAIAYSSPDLAVAYFENAIGGIKARTVVNTKDMQWVKIYGDEVRLSGALREAGYTEGCIAGCRIAKIPYRDDFLMPYLDTVGKVDDYDDDYWVISHDGEHDAQHCSGLLEIHSGMEQCPDCEEYCDEDNMSGTDDDTYVCEVCRDDHYNVVHGRHGRSLRHTDNCDSDSGVWMVDDEFYTTEWLQDNDYVFVESVAEWFELDSVVQDHFTDEWILAEDATSFYERDEDGDVDESTTLYTADDNSIDTDTIDVPQYVRA